ncbi:hypothetical protein L2E82_10974 [Cichorium intybus]|uniref:Uncharacterized protein n=1 Tax=Cichorium intybus TaxID=13427 RepID=A0ACB9GD31_CICIN|nr:hypothetical protein L2E82_10974 [Cichorium intybus]
MSYTALDTFYVTDDQLHNSPSRKDGVSEATERTLRTTASDRHGSGLVPSLLLQDIICSFQREGLILLSQIPLTPFQSYRAVISYFCQAEDDTKTWRHM